MSLRIEGDGDEKLILDGQRLAGSIVRHGTGWRVEVLWRGPGGDMIYKAASLHAAMAFLAGVDEMLKRVTVIAEFSGDRSAPS